MISIEQAAAQGIERLRRPIWASQFDHLKIDIFQGTPGPWVHLYCPMNVYMNNHDPIDILCTEVSYTTEDWIPYAGAASDSAEYKKEAAIWAETKRAKELMK